MDPSHHAELSECLVRHILEFTVRYDTISQWQFSIGQETAYAQTVPLPTQIGLASSMVFLFVWIAPVRVLVLALTERSLESARCCMTGIHRGFGVHISYVRSVPMDKWNDDQINVMKVCTVDYCIAL
jgi:hypothetical protein